MLNLKDSEECVLCAVHGFDPPEGGQDTGAGRLKPVSQTVGSYGAELFSEVECFDRAATTDV
jgi:hypothetical protein